MLKRGMVIAASLFAAGVACGAFAADSPRTLGTVQLDSRSPMKISGLPIDSVRGVLYSVGRTSGQRCGLVSANAAAAKRAAITTILEPEAGEDWPSCDSFLGGAVFKWRGNTGYVVRYRQRDTREDATNNDFFVQESTLGLQAIDVLNGEAKPENKSVQEMAAWAKSRLLGLDNETSGYKTSMADSILTDRAFLSVSRNGSVGQCRVNVDFTATDSQFAAVTTPCQSVLATTAIVDRDGAIFVVMTRAADGRPHGQVFIVDAAGVREASDIEQTLKPEVASGKILTVKKALKRLIAR